MWTIIIAIVLWLFLMRILGIFTLLRVLIDGIMWLISVYGVGSSKHVDALTEIIDAQRTGALIVVVNNVYQHAVRGTKANAIVQGKTWDVWFWWVNIPSDSIVAVHGFNIQGWGPHNAHEIIYIGDEDHPASLQWITIRAARESRRWWIRQLNKRNISHEDAMRYACLIAAADDLLFLRTPQKVKKLIEQHDVA